MSNISSISTSEWVGTSIRKQFLFDSFLYNLLKVENFNALGMDIYDSVAVKVKPERFSPTITVMGTDIMLPGYFVTDREGGVIRVEDVDGGVDEMSDVSSVFRAYDGITKRYSKIEATGGEQLAVRGKKDVGVRLLLNNYMRIEDGVLYFNSPRFFLSFVLYQVAVMCNARKEREFLFNKHFLFYNSFPTGFRAALSRLRPYVYVDLGIFPWEQKKLKIGINRLFPRKVSKYLETYELNFTYDKKIDDIYNIIDDAIAFGIQIPVVKDDKEYSVGMKELTGYVSEILELFLGVDFLS